MRLLLIYIGFLFVSFNPPYKNSSSSYLPKIAIAKKPLLSYDSMKSIISKQRLSLKISKEKRNYILLEQRFVSIVADSIFPYWYGTAWDFNGTTQTPGKGAIACGYFVSTVLRDAGVPLNRIKMGQSASQVFVKTFAEKSSIKVFDNKPLDSTINFIKSKGTGLFIVGLDYHVGFIYNDGKNVWFIHSKWVNPKSVVKEDGPTSGVLYYSKYRIVGKISSNKSLLDAWIDHK